VPEWVPDTVSDTSKGKAAYAKACESCHGPNASGSQAPALVPFTLELSELIAIVRQGVGVMPGMPRDRVSDEEISAIRDYLINLKK
jgi:mono/diheme cytochrome c family protein